MWRDRHTSDSLENVCQTCWIHMAKGTLTASSICGRLTKVFEQLSSDLCRNVYTCNSTASAAVRCRVFNLVGRVQQNQSDWTTPQDTYFHYVVQPIKPVTLSSNKGLLLWNKATLFSCWGKAKDYRTLKSLEQISLEVLVWWEASSTTHIQNNDSDSDSQRSHSDLWQIDIIDVSVIVHVLLCHCTEPQPQSETPGSWRNWHDNTFSYQLIICLSFVLAYHFKRVPEHIFVARHVTATTFRSRMQDTKFITEKRPQNLDAACVIPPTVSWQDLSAGAGPAMVDSGTNAIIVPLHPGVKGEVAECQLSPKCHSHWSYCSSLWA